MRFVFFITLVFLSTLMSPILVFLVSVLYALLWDGYELIILGACIDTYFGAGISVPYYTLGAFVIVYGATWCKPKLLLYTT